MSTTYLVAVHTSSSSRELRSCLLKVCAFYYDSLFFLFMCACFRGLNLNRYGRVFFIFHLLLISYQIKKTFANTPIARCKGDWSCYDVVKTYLQNAAARESRDHLFPSTTMSKGKKRSKAPGPPPPIRRGQAPTTPPRPSGSTGGAGATSQSDADTFYADLAHFSNQKPIDSLDLSDEQDPDAQIDQTQFHLELMINDIHDTADFVLNHPISVAPVFVQKVLLELSAALKAAGYMDPTPRPRPTPSPPRTSASVQTDPVPEPAAPPPPRVLVSSATQTPAPTRSPTPTATKPSFVQVARKAVAKDKARKPNPSATAPVTRRPTRGPHVVSSGLTSIIVWPTPPPPASRPPALVDLRRAFPVNLFTVRWTKCGNLAVTSTEGP
jgi:hypothetical protein